MQPAISTTTPAPAHDARPRRILLLGATGTIGRATALALAAHGYEVVCCGRNARTGDALPGVEARTCDVTDLASLLRDGMRGERFDVLVSCLASRTGAPADAWAIDHAAHLTALEAARQAGVTHFVLLSALCVQKPLLAFQQAKLAFEKALVASGLTYSIVRPTAFFKSLSGQVGRVRRDKPFLLFGDGTLTACKPISDRDLGEFIAGCVADETRHNRILPIGGPGPAITPRQQGEYLARAFGRAPSFRHVPVGLLDAIIALLGALGRFAPALAAKAELARIGRYYATESMLVWDAAAGRYDPDATPSTGQDTLFDFYDRLASGREAAPDRREHAVF